LIYIPNRKFIFDHGAQLNVLINSYSNFFSNLDQLVYYNNAYFKINLNASCLMSTILYSTAYENFLSTKKPFWLTANLK